MKLEYPVRMGGLAAILAGVLLVFSDLLRLYINNPAGTGALESIFFVEGWISVLLAVVVQLGLVGLYAPQARGAGVLGLIGLVLASIAVRLTMGSSFVYRLRQADRVSLGNRVVLGGTPSGGIGAWAEFRPRLRTVRGGHVQGPGLPAGRRHHSSSLVR
jgi:hypothetical protein